MDTIRDVKPPIDLPPDLWWLWLLLVVAVVGLGLWWWLHRLKTRASIVTAAPIVAPWDKAYQQLDALIIKSLHRQGAFKLFYSELSDILRQYIEACFQIGAPHMTTEEFLQYINTRGTLNEGHRRMLGDFLAICDMVKFAKGISSENEALKAFGSVKGFIDETKPRVDEHGL